MENDELMFFNMDPEALPLYEEVRSRLLSKFPETLIKVQRSQITFKAKYGFAFVSLRRMKGCPKVFIILTIGLNRRLDSPRVAIAVEPCPNRWTHHFIISEKEQINDEMMAWLSEAHDFALLK